MVGRRTVALAVVVLAAVLITSAVVGNYTVAKDEVKHQYKEHAQESVENTKDCARSWAAWAKDRVLGLFMANQEVAHGEDERGDRPGKAEEVKGLAVEKAGELKEGAKEMKERVGNKAYETKEEVRQCIGNEGGGCKDEL